MKNHVIYAICLHPFRILNNEEKLASEDVKDKSESEPNGKSKPPDTETEEVVRSYKCNE